jgi:hypothetical protein
MDCRLQGYPSPLLISYILEGSRCWWWGLVPVLEVAQRWLCWAGIWGIITSVATNHDASHLQPQQQQRPTRCDPCQHH